MAGTGQVTQTLFGSSAMSADSGAARPQSGLKCLRTTKRCATLAGQLQNAEQSWAEAVLEEGWVRALGQLPTSSSRRTIARLRTN